MAQPEKDLLQVPGKEAEEWFFTEIKSGGKGAAAPFKNENKVTNNIMLIKILTLCFDTSIDGFDNKQLARIAVKKPETLAALKEIEGIGTKKVQKYGDEVLGLVKTGKPPGGSMKKQS